MSQEQNLLSHATTRNWQNHNLCVSNTRVLLCICIEKCVGHRSLDSFTCFIRLRGRFYHQDSTPAISYSDSQNKNRGCFLDPFLDLSKNSWKLSQKCLTLRGTETLHDHLQESLSTAVIRVSRSGMRGQTCLTLHNMDIL